MAEAARERIAWGRREKLQAEFDRRLTRYFDKQSSSPSEWLRLADDLRESARVVWEKYQHYAGEPGPGPLPWLGPTALMLAGMSIEALIKARLVTQHKVKPPATHELVQLARRSNIRLFGTEWHLLKRLTQFVVWS